MALDRSRPQSRQVRPQARRRELVIAPQKSLPLVEEIDEHLPLPGIPAPPELDAREGEERIFIGGSSGRRRRLLGAEARGLLGAECTQTLRAHVG